LSALYTVVVVQRGIVRKEEKMCLRQLFTLPTFSDDVTHKWRRVLYFLSKLYMHEEKGEEGTVVFVTNCERFLGMCLCDNKVR
jgi:hypothetical protein